MTVVTVVTVVKVVTVVTVVIEVRKKFATFFFFKTKNQNCDKTQKFKL